MTVILECDFSDDGWAAHPQAEVWMSQAASAALEECGLAQRAFLISVLAAGDERIQALNAQFRGLDKATNVLSWPQHDLPEPADLSDIDGDPVFLGDVALGLQTIMREAAAAERPLEHHLQHLIIHSVLHLLGFDHHSEEMASQMELMEIRALARLGVANPYIDRDPSTGALTEQE
ncbi:MAG: rRNA maturation RNase YbeY [Neomegalonema sp.]|nr:rRNA maturation RNase YbeY [Neomegalonema sp.]